MKSRISGAILLILSIALIATGIFAGQADVEGTPFNDVYQSANEYRAAVAALEKSIADAQDAMERMTKRSADAISQAEACIAAAEDAKTIEADGSYDEETDAGALGQAILEAQASGQEVQAILDSYAPVYHAELVESLEEAKTTAKRAENAVEDGAAALQTVISSTQYFADMIFEPLPEFVPAEVPKLGSLTGIERLLTRGQNYLTRGAAAQEGAIALNEAGAKVVASAQDVLKNLESAPALSAVTFAHARSLDLIVIGSMLLAVAGILLLFPAWIAKKWKNPWFRKGFWFVLVVGLLGAALHYASGEMWTLMQQGVFDTLYMTIPATIFSYLLGLPLGVLLVITAPGHIRPNATLNSVLGTVVNFLRSIPFIILLVMLFDVTRLVMGSAIGTRAVIFPLFVSAFPYVARIVEGSLNEVDRGVIEAAQSMGSTTWQIIRKVLIPEAMPSLINGAAICMTTILAYTAMAGSAGGDGLGKIAITYGLNYREYDIMYVSSLLLVALVQIIQIGGGILMRAVDHRKK